VFVIVVLICIFLSFILMYLWTAHPNKHALVHRPRSILRYDLRWIEFVHRVYVSMDMRVSSSISAWSYSARSRANGKVYLAHLHKNHTV
jgi:hypothetical protein